MLKQRWLGAGLHGSGGYRPRHRLRLIGNAMLNGVAATRRRRAHVHNMILMPPHGAVAIYARGYLYPVIFVA